MSFPVRQYYVTLDINDGVTSPMQKVRQGDSNSGNFNISLTDDKAPLDLTGCTTKFAVRKPDGLYVYQTPVVVNAVTGNISVLLSSQTIAVAGKAQADVSIYGSNGERLTMLEFTFEIDEVIDIENAIESSNDLPALTELILDSHTHANKAILDAITSSSGGSGSTVADSATNGNVLINGTETKVYDDTAITVEYTAVNASVTANATAITATNATVSANASANATALTAKANQSDLTTANANVTANATAITATNVNVGLKANQSDLVITNGNVTTNATAITATNVNVTANATAITATNVNVGLKANQTDLAITNSNVTANSTSITNKRDKAVLLNATADFDSATKTMMTGTTPITYSPIPTALSVIPSMIDSNMKQYPFATSVVITNLEFVHAIKDIRLFGADPTLQYTLGNIMRNLAGRYLLRVCLWTAGAMGTTVCAFDITGYVEGSLCNMATLNSSGVSGYVIIDWSAVTNGASYVNNPYSIAGLHQNTYVNTGLPVKRLVAKSPTSITFSGTSVTIQSILAIRNDGNYDGLLGATTLKCSGAFDYIIASNISGNAVSNITLTKGLLTYFWMELPTLLPTQMILMFKTYGMWSSDYADIKDAITKAQVVIPTYSMLRYLPAPNANVLYPTNCYFLGRWYPKVVNSVASVVSIDQGAEIYCKVSNTANVNINFYNVSSATNEIYVAVSIDGGAFTRYKLTTGYVIALTGLTLTDHYIRIVASGINEHDAVWEAGQGLVFQSLTVDTLGTSVAVKPSNRKGLFIGDSITEGVNVLGSGAVPITNCGEQAYPFVCCGLLNSVSLRDGFGGSGVTVGGNGGVPIALGTIDFDGDGVPFTMDLPDFIVVNHGTNDTVATSPVFQLAYDTLLKKLQNKYPCTPIFCMIPFNGVRLTDITTVCANNNCNLVDTTGWAMTFTDGTHPDVAGSIVGGTNLATAIKNVLGFSHFV
jgi:hypothetical protein